MTIALIALLFLAVPVLAALGLEHFGGIGRSSDATDPDTRRILFPFVAQAVSTRALDAAVRLAKAEDATLVPVFIEIVPAQLPLDATRTEQSAHAVPLHQAIAERANELGVPIDARAQRGRTYRHALRQTIGQERFARIVIAAAAKGSPGFDADDVAWLLNHAAGEILVLRPHDEDRLAPSPRPSRRGRAPGRRGRRVPAAANDDGHAAGTAGEPQHGSRTRARLTS